MFPRVFFPASGFPARFFPARLVRTGPEMRVVSDELTVISEGEEE